MLFSPEVIKRSVDVSYPAIGDGNPATTWLIYEQLATTYPAHEIAITRLDWASGIASLAHKTITKFGILSKFYTQNSTNVRDSGPSRLLGQAMFGELIYKRKDQHQQKSVWIPVQEFQLEYLANHPKLAKEYCEHIFLPIPDVQPKESAIRLMRLLGDHVIPLTWNKQTKEMLEKQGFKPQLVKPFFSPLTEQEIMLSQKYTPRYSVIKESGSGADPLLISTARNYC
jgi:hypothetical protein